MTGATWLTNEDLAERYKVPLATIRKWRAEGRGPRGVRFGRHVRYSLESSVLPWEAAQIAEQAS